MASECKRSSNSDRAGRKADGQIRRFQNTITNGEFARMRHEGKQTYQPANFENVLRYGKVSSRGTLENGFEGGNRQLPRRRRPTPTHIGYDPGKNNPRVSWFSD